jgi:hypothetical protein
MFRSFRSRSSLCSDRNPCACGVFQLFQSIYRYAREGRWMGREIYGHREKYVETFENRVLTGTDWNNWNTKRAHVRETKKLTRRF